MPQWELRPPSTFPRAFHEAVLQGPGEYVIASTFTERAIRRWQIEWRLFMFSLRNHDQHELHKAAKWYVFRARKHHDSSTGRFELHLTIRPPLMEEIEKIG